jgi:hypothetical protein
MSRRKGVLTLARAGSSEPAAAELRSFLSHTGYANVFNPSVWVGDDSVHVVFRAVGRSGHKPFEAFYGTRSDGAWTVVELSPHVAEWAVGPVADPKLFATPEGLFVTFNTGTPSTGPNQLCVMQVQPELGEPMVCRLEDRQRIEKNWAFFHGPDGLSAVYGLQPLVLVDLVRSEGRQLEFRPRRTGATGAVATRRPLSLGTQPVIAADGRMLMVGHEKFWWRRRRGYVGRPLVVDGTGTDRPAVRVSPMRLIHSYRDALPRLSPAHNPNLWSATYFSGLAPCGDSYLLSYGVNDVGFGVSVAGSGIWCE